jgi:hypothetical protein
MVKGLGRTVLIVADHADAAAARALQDLDRTFPGFSHDIHGVEPAADGTYRIMCVKDAAPAAAVAGASEASASGASASWAGASGPESLRRGAQARGGQAAAPTIDLTRGPRSTS